MSATAVLAPAVPESARFEPDPFGSPDPISRSAGEELVALGSEINANQYRAVHLAARYDDEREWFHAGLATPAVGISRQLHIHTSTAREWIRVGHSLRWLPHIDHAFATNQISYAKARILTRWADDTNEQDLLDLATTRSADRLTTAIARQLDHTDPDDDARDRRLHDQRSLTTYTDGDGMTIIRIALPPSIAKPLLAAIDETVRRIANTPIAADPATAEPDDDVNNPPADAPQPHSPTTGKPDSDVNNPPADAPDIRAALGELRQRWQPTETDDWSFPTIAQQRADALTALYLTLPIQLTTELVIHIRADGNTFDDGTPLTTNAITRQLDTTFIRLLIHDAERNPIDATNKRRHPTTRQKRLTLEKHHHQCVDCHTTHLLELDHNPPYAQTRHTITTQLQPRCTPCHRARHRYTSQSTDRVRD